MMRRGVPAGAAIPNQERASKFGTPASLNVGKPERGYTA
jgi:hypothetical protein